MTKIETLYLPMKAVVSPLPSSSFAAGSEVTIETNIPGFILYTTDGSIPTEGEFGTVKEEAPVTIKISTTTTLKYKAIDNRLDKGFNQTKTQTQVYTVTRRNPVEIFRDNKHFFKKMDAVLVDHNFYAGGGDWVVPVSETPYTYLYKNNEGFTARVRLLLNGIDALNVSPYPQLNAGQIIEFTISPRSGDNNVEIQTGQTIF